MYSEKLYRFTEPFNDLYAKASRINYEYPEPQDSKRIKPLVFIWESGSDLIGDFTWPGFDDNIIITERVCDFFYSEKILGFEPAPVEILENNLKRKKIKYVNMPYRGPRLFDLWVTTWVHFNIQYSTVDRFQDEDGFYYKVNGIVKNESLWDSQTMELKKVKISRISRKGIFVHKNDLHGSNIFGILEFPEWIFCTEKMKRLIELNSFTNVSFLEMGNLLD
ncbi:hypothetical protein B2G47_07165 [Leptospira interrogans serovar Canicola]|nr:hypothetical protein B2G47_07165 [Leptospira interrogans serovar Canicola]